MNNYFSAENIWYSVGKVLVGGIFAYIAFDIIEEYKKEQK